MGETRITLWHMVTLTVIIAVGVAGGLVLFYYVVVPTFGVPGIGT